LGSIGKGRKVAQYPAILGLENATLVSFANPFHPALRDGLDGERRLRT